MVCEYIISIQKTSRFTTQCKGDKSHAFKTEKNKSLFDLMMYKSPDVPLQDELLILTSQFRTSKPPMLAWMGTLIQVWYVSHSLYHRQRSSAAVVRPMQKSIEKWEIRPL